MANALPAPSASRGALPAGAGGSRAGTAAAGGSPLRTLCAGRVPTQPIRTVLNPAAPTIAPTVLAAYTPPTSRPGSWPRAAAASASGKLAPHSTAAGSTAQVQRIRSSWKLYHGLGDRSGLIGQY